MIWVAFLLSNTVISEFETRLVDSHELFDKSLLAVLVGPCGRDVF